MCESKAEFIEEMNSLGLVRATNQRWIDLMYELEQERKNEQET